MYIPLHKTSSEAKMFSYGFLKQYICAVINIKTPWQKCWNEHPLWREVDPPPPPPKQCCARINVSKDRARMCLALPVSIQNWFGGRGLITYLIICIGSCTFVQSFQQILWMIVALTNKQTDRQKNIQAGRQTDKKTGRQNDWRRNESNKRTYIDR